MNERLAGGKLLLDSPAEAVARLRISNPERRNALDHEILDALAETLPRLDRGIETRCVVITGAPPVFSAGYDIAAIPPETFERDAEALVAHPFHAAMEAIAAHPWPTVAAINGHCLGGGLELAITCDLRICAAGAKLGMPPAKLGLDLRPHRAAQVPRHDRPGADQGAVPHRPQRRAPRAPSRSASSTRWSATRSWRRRRSSWPRRSPPTRRSRCAATSARSTCSTQCPRSPSSRRRGLIALRESCFASEDFREGIRAFAEKRKPRWTGTVSAKAQAALAAADPTMAALIERIGEIDLATRLRRRSEERPADAYGALLRAIVGQQLSTKAARTIYLRVLRPLRRHDAGARAAAGGERGGPARRRPLRPQGRVHPRPRRPRAQRRAGAGPSRPALRRGGDRGDRRRARPRPVDRGDVPALPPRAARRPLRRRPRHPQGGPDRVRARGDAGAHRGCWRSASPGARTAASPRSTCGSRWRPSPEGKALGQATPLADNRAMRLRFWLGLAAVARDRDRLGRRRPGRPRPRKRQLRADASATRRSAPPARREAVAALSVGQLASAAAFYQAEGSFSRHEFDVDGRLAAEPGRSDGDRASSCAVPALERARFERAHGFPIVERSPSRLPRRAGTAPAYFPLTFAASDSEPRTAARLRPRRRPRARPYLLRARDSGRPAATPVMHLPIGGTGHQRLPARLPRRRPDRDRGRSAAPPWSGSRSAPSTFPDLTAAATRRVPDDVDVQLGRGRPDGRPAQALLARRSRQRAAPDRRPHLAAGRPRPEPARRRACRVLIAVVGIVAGGPAGRAGPDLEPQRADAGAAAPGRATTR